MDIIQNQAFLLLGSNLGNRMLNLESAKREIQQYANIIQESRLYETAPWKMEDKTPWFLNQVIEISTSASPADLLNYNQAIEAKLGRKANNSSHYTSRELDIDILYFNQECINLEKLVVPHPRLHERMFTLLPLNDIASSFIHPRLRLSNFELMKQCNDTSIIREFMPT